MSQELGENLPRWQRPIRIPANVPIGHADPPVAVAGRKGTWRLEFELTEDVAAGQVLKLQLHGGRNNKAGFRGPQVDRPAAEGYVTAATADGAALPLAPDEKHGTFVITAPQAGLARGSRVIVTIGNKAAGAAGIEAIPHRMLNKFFLLHRGDDERLAGTHRDKHHPRGTWTEENQHLIVGACTLHVIGDAIDHLRAYVPSQCRRGEPIRLLVRPEDQFSNLSHERLGPLAVLLGERELPAEREAVADSTCAALTVRLPAPGIHRLTVRDRRSGRQTASNPTVCAANPPPYQVYWGMIHGHTEMSDGTGTLENYFRQMRDEAGLDFAAPGDHDHLFETSEALWGRTCAAVAAWHAPGEFVTLLGYEWAKWRRNGDGDRNVYYLQDARPMYRSDDGCCATPPELFEALRDEQAIVIPHHTAHAGNFCDFKDHDPTCERLVEIFQIRGSYECSEEDGNPLPERRTEPPMAVGYVRRALAMGWRVGFTAGGDDHIGHAGTEHPIPFGDCAYKAGLTAVLAAERTRQGIWDAMWNRRVIATSGPRILLSYTINGRDLGGELQAAEMPELLQRRQLRARFHGTAPLARLDVIRSNRLVHSVEGGGQDVELEWTDQTPLAEALLPAATFCPHPFCFYYVRAVQADGEVAWACPTWIDPRA